MNFRRVLASGSFLTILAGGHAAFAADAAPAPSPPPAAGSPYVSAEAGKAAVAAPKEIAGPTIAKPDEDRLSAQVTFGGSWLEGNSKQLVGTLSGDVERRFGDNQLKLSTIANYGQGAPGDAPVRELARNIWTRGRYDRYFTDRIAGFFLLQHRYDRFQGIDTRLNFDPGVKFVALDDEAVKAWVEAGYDLQHDIRRNEDRVQYTDDAKTKVLVDTAGNPILVDKTYTDHSMRLFAGGKYAFSSTVSVSAGLEYLQSFKDTDRYRLNVDALAAANLFAGFSAGVGFTARYDHAPLAGKKDLDTMMTLNVIYSFTDPAPAKKDKDCPAPQPCPTCPEPPPPPPPGAVAPPPGPPPAPPPVAPPPPPADAPPPQPNP